MITEYDLVNSFHVHGDFFDYYPTGTSKTPTELTDTIMMCQGQRGAEECLRQMRRWPDTRPRQRQPVSTADDDLSIPTATKRWQAAASAERGTPSLGSILLRYVVQGG